jgi:hypothetical protein
MTRMLITLLQPLLVASLAVTVPSLVPTCLDHDPALHSVVTMSNELWGRNKEIVDLRASWGLVDSAGGELVLDEAVCQAVLRTLHASLDKKWSLVAYSTGVAVYQVGPIYIAAIPEDPAYTYILDRQFQLRTTFCGCQ